MDSEWKITYDSNQKLDVHWFATHPRMEQYSDNAAMLSAKTSWGIKHLVFKTERAWLKLDRMNASKR